MDGALSQPEAADLAWRFVAALILVALHGFCVAAQVGLVRARGAELVALSTGGSVRARMAQHLVSHPEGYVLACQLGITISTLLLGWLAEPAVATLLGLSLGALGGESAANTLVLRAVALVVAVTGIAVLLTTLGEQAPRLWAIRQPTATAVRLAHPLRALAAMLQPLVWVVSRTSSTMLRVAGISAERLAEASLGVEDLRSVLVTSARAGHISGRQLELAENVFGMMELEVRHILVPRVDVAFLTLQQSPEENLQTIRRTAHSRFPLCTADLDSVVGIVHAKDVMMRLVDGGVLDLRPLARSPIFVPDTQPLSWFIGRMQQTRSHCAIVVDEHGTAVGLAFLEDAIEEIVGPIHDEFDSADPGISRAPDGVVEVPGSLALPEAVDVLELPELADETDTLGGYVVARLGRLPTKGDVLDIGRYQVTVLEVSRRRVMRVRFTPTVVPAETGS